MKRFIRLDEKNQVISVRFGSSILDGEIESEYGVNGQIMQEDGTFKDPVPVPVETQPTLEEKVAGLQQDNLILMDALASTFEEILNLKALLGGTA